MNHGVPARGLATACGTILAVACSIVPAIGAERSLSTTSHHASPEGMRLVIEVEDHDVELRAADVGDIAVTTELSISGLGRAKADR